MFKTNHLTLFIFQFFGIISLMISFFYPYLCPRGHTITPKLNFCQICCQKCSIRFNLIISNVWCQIVLVPNCPVPNCPGAKLSGCQIVHFYYLGAKLSAFIILVPNCPLYYLGAKLSGAKLSGAKLSYNPADNQNSYATPQQYDDPSNEAPRIKSHIFQVSYLPRTRCTFNPPVFLF